MRLRPRRGGRLSRGLQKRSEKRSHRFDTDNRTRGETGNDQEHMVYDEAARAGVVAYRG